MPLQKNNVRSLFLEAEILASRFSLASSKRSNPLVLKKISGILPPEVIQSQIAFLSELDVDAYIQQTVSPSEHPKRRNAAEVIRQLGGTLIHEEIEGPLYMAEIEFLISGRRRRLGFIAQNRKFNNGVWSPQHHLKAAEWIRFFDSHSTPVITFIDTPGAAADVEANLQNQSHSISFLIAEMANLTVPSVGIVFGHGYSGGAIPLASTNLLFSVRDGVFNTIHPKGLSSIARKYNLSWQECAKYIGISSYELCQKGYFDGVIDYAPDSPKQLIHLRDTIFTAVESIESSAMDFLKGHSFFFQYYQDSIQHFMNPSAMLVEDNKLTDKTPTGVLNIFGSVYRFLRYLKLREKIRSQTVQQYSRLSKIESPKGTLLERLQKERDEKFQKWIQTPLEVRYHEELNKKYLRFIETGQYRSSERGKLATLFMGSPQENYERAIIDLGQSLLMYLYNHWKGDAPENLVQLFEYLKESPKDRVSAPISPNLLDLLQLAPLLKYFQENFQNIILFDLLYDGIVLSLPLIAEELRGNNCISQASVETLFEAGFTKAIEALEKHFVSVNKTDVKRHFFRWLAQFVAQKNCDAVMKTITDWKQVMFPRMSAPLFGVVRYYFSGLLPSLYRANQRIAKFEGKITPRNIGIKDFWNRLDHAYKDLLIQDLLRNYKKKPISPQQVIDLFFTDFRERFASNMTADPVNFPGFRSSIEEALNQGTPACGVVTGLAVYSDGGLSTRVGLVVSNNPFQAGAFDMASCEKVCRLLTECAYEKLPVILFIASGGMQTKEGAGALFSMPVINDRLTRFVKDHDLPVICFGFRDCMGGAQASFVTHRLVKTYYLSGTLMSFAGQLVVESHLTAQSTLSNYLSVTAGSMAGLVKNPFDEDIDQRLQQIDSKIPIPHITVKEAISQVLSGEYKPDTLIPSQKASLFEENVRFQPIHRLLIHARGCTATRLIQAAHAAEMEVILVQSDADMESYPTKLLKEHDRLVCLGGNTPQESYLNAMSVIRIAEQEDADAVHPGIGFLSESSSYARLCREHGLNFVGPRAASMDLMGNKSNAIATAKRLEIPVVPGSQGALTHAEQGLEAAEEIGFPVLIKSAHGGGGKGIRVVWEKEKFVSLFGQMSQEALNAFGNGDLYLEKYIQSMRHLEVQVLRDGVGTIHLLGIRDCSVQRQFQKLIEESADSTLPKVICEELYRHSKKLLNDIDYLGAGTVEFIYDRQEQRVYFMEMNTRLQVEHPVSEMVCDIDLVQQQFQIAQGKTLKGKASIPKGHAMEIRITAERLEFSEQGMRFLPEPGKITELRLPSQPNIRILSSVTKDSVIPPYYDSLIAQVIAWGNNRLEAIETLLQYLVEVRVHGVSTNIALMESILKDAVFRSNDYDTNYLDSFFPRISIPALQKKVVADSGGSGMGLDQESIRIPDSDELKVLSPQTGIFYRSSSPSEPVFVEEGQLISLDHPLCLMESMKVFKELTLGSFNIDPQNSMYSPDFKFQVKRILSENQQTVSKGDLLFVVLPIAQ